MLCVRWAEARDTHLGNEQLRPKAWLSPSGPRQHRIGKISLIQHGNRAEVEKSWFHVPVHEKCHYFPLSSFYLTSSAIILPTIPTHLPVLECCC